MHVDCSVQYNCNLNSLKLTKKCQDSFFTRISKKCNGHAFFEWKKYHGRHRTLLGFLLLWSCRILSGDSESRRRVKQYTQNVRARCLSIELLVSFKLHSAQHWRPKERRFPEIISEFFCIGCLCCSSLQARWSSESTSIQPSFSWPKRSLDSKWCSYSRFMNLRICASFVVLCKRFGNQKYFKCELLLTAFVNQI